MVFYRTAMMARMFSYSICKNLLYKLTRCSLCVRTLVTGHVLFRMNTHMFLGNTSFLKSIVFRKPNNKRTLMHLYNYYEFEDLDVDSRLKSSETTVSRKFLFPENQDPHLKKIVNSDSQELLQMAESLNPLTIEQASQTIVSFYDINKPSVQGYFKDSYHIVSELASSETFDKVFLILNNEFKNLPDEALVATLLALSKLKISDKDNSLTESLLIECCERMPKLALKEVSKVTSIIKGLNYNSSDFYFASAIDVISSQIVNCADEEILQYVAIGLYNTSSLVSSHCISRFADKVEEFILEHQEMSFKTAHACLSVFGKYEWRKEYIDLQEKLLTFVVDCVPKLIAPELSSLFWKIIYCSCNTHELVHSIEKRNLELVNQSSCFLEKLVLLNCLKSNVNKLQHKFEVKTHLEGCLKDVDPQNELHVQLVFSTLINLYPLKCEQLVETYINHAFATLPDNALVHCCRPYFLWKWGSSDYHQDSIILDKSYLLKILGSKIQSSVKLFEFVFFTSMWIANSPSTVPQKQLYRLISIIPQLDTFSLSTISLVLNLIFKNLPSNYEHMFLRLNYSLFETYRRKLYDCDNLSRYVQLLMLMSDVKYRAFTVKKNGKNLFGENLISDYDRFLEETNSNPADIFLICKLLSKNQIFLPLLLNNMASSVVDRPSLMDCACITKLLSSCYVANYYPQVPGFLEKCQEILISQNEYTTCSDLLSSALSLGLLQALNEKLIHLIFNEDFLEKMGKEVSVSVTYQAKVMKFTMATLNRLVCLDFPQVNLPWLHEDYFRNYYSKNFECQLDKSNNPIAYSDTLSERTFETTSHCSPGARRVAIDILWKKDFCRNVRRVRGSVALKQRHLEILGYKVVQIPYYEWNYSNSGSEDMLDYLRNKIF